MTPEDLLVRCLPEDVVDGIRVRSLSRGEVITFKKLGRDEEAIEVAMLATAIIDPVLTEDQVRQWRDVVSVGAVQRVIDKIEELSGISAGAQKSGAASDDAPGD